MLTPKTIQDLPLEEKVLLAQDGDQELLNELLDKYQPFIAKSVSEVCKRYINPAEDDEFSIGLSAFHDAIQSFKPERGSTFLSFAKLVITRRVIDYIRSVQREPETSSLDEHLHVEEQMENPLEVAIVNDQYKQQQDAWYRKQEITEFTQILATYRLSFKELITASPKHKDARESAVRIARIIYEDEYLSNYVRDKKKLPIKDLLTKVDVSKKTLERNRRYIIAIFIVLDGDFVYLQDYLKGVGL